MRICIVGAGAVGGHLAASLARAGATVSVLVRGENLRAIREHGLTVREDSGSFTAQVAAASAAEALGQQDAVLVTVKSYALPDVAAPIAAMLAADGYAVFLQNGLPWWYFHGAGAQEGRRLESIDPGHLLWEMVGPRRAIGGTTSSACTLVAPGVVQVKGGNRPMVLGEPDGSESPRVLALAALLRTAGFPVEVTPRIRDKIWDKLVLNLASGPMAVLAPSPLNEMFAEPALIEARLRICDEVAAIASAMGCRTRVDARAGLASAQASAHIPSIGQDAAAGRRFELEAMFRAPLMLARECGVPTPTLDLLVALATLKAKAASPPR